MRFWRLGTTPAEKILTQTLSWRPGGKKSLTTKQWGFHGGPDITVRCVARTGRKPIGVRWRDTNKGDWYNVNVRSRLVAKEFNKKKCDDLFAGTPLVEAMRAIISMAASGATPKTLMTVDVSRAYMFAKCRSEMYVELCPEAYEEDGDEKCCWRLEKAMYGTRSAAQLAARDQTENVVDWISAGKVEPVLVLQPFLRSLHAWCTVTTSWLQVKNQH